MTGATFHIPTLTTERLTLRAPTRGDFDAYAAFYLSARSGAGSPTRPPTRRGAWKAFAKDVVDWALGGVGHWTVSHGRTPVGFVGFSQPDYYPEAEMGWALYDGYEGAGYATEAARAARDWAKGRLSSLVSYVAPDNARSIALAERLGARVDTAARLPEGHSAATCLVFRHWGPA